jgi:hypothetical protein
VVFQPNRRLFHFQFFFVIRVPHSNLGVRRFGARATWILLFFLKKMAFQSCKILRCRKICTLQVCKKSELICILGCVKLK